MKKVKLFEDYSIEEKKITISWNDDDNALVFSDGEIARVDYDGDFKYRDEWFETADHEGPEDLIKDLQKRFKRDKFEWISESSVNEAKKYKFKDLAKAWEFVYGEDMEDEYQGFYQEVTGKYKNKVTKKDIAEIWQKVYGEDIEAEYGGFYNELKENEESVNEKVKLIMRNILSKMVPAAFGPTTSPKMREEIRDAVEAAIEPILKKYDYIVESELYEKNFQVVVGGEAIEYTLSKNLAGNGIIAIASSSKDLDKEIESGASKTAIAKDIEDNINSRLKRMRQDITVNVDYRYEGAGYGFKLNLDGILQKLNK